MTNKINRLTVDHLRDTYSTGQLMKILYEMRLRERRKCKNLNNLLEVLSKLNVIKADTISIELIKQYGQSGILTQEEIDEILAL